MARNEKIEDIIAAIQKLLRVAELNRSGETVYQQNEATNAAAAAQRLMAEYNIEQAMLDGSDINDANAIGRDLWTADEHGFKGSKVTMKWETALASAIAKAHYCLIVRAAENNSVWFCGTPSNRAVAMYMYTYLRRAGELLAKVEYHAAHKAGRVKVNHSELHAWRLGFFIGYRNALATRYEEMAAQLRTEYAGNAQALMVMSGALQRVDGVLKDLFNGQIKDTTAGKLRYHLDGHARGTHHGNNVNLNNRGIGASSKPAPGLITDRTRLLGS